MGTTGTESAKATGRVNLWTRGQVTTADGHGGALPSKDLEAGQFCDIATGYERVGTAGRQVGT
jgi:hypothetical protein